MSVVNVRTASQNAHCCQQRDKHSIVPFCFCAFACTTQLCSLVLQDRIDEVKGALAAANMTFGAKKSEPKDVETYAFKKDPKDFNVYWDVRKGLIPIVGGARETGAPLLNWSLQTCLLAHPSCHLLRCLITYLCTDALPQDV